MAHVFQRAVHPWKDWSTFAIAIYRFISLVLETIKNVKLADHFETLGRLTQTRRVQGLEQRGKWPVFRSRDAYDKNEKSLTYNE